MIGMKPEFFWSLETCNVFLDEVGKVTLRKPIVQLEELAPLSLEELFLPFVSLSVSLFLSLSPFLSLLFLDTLHSFLLEFFLLTLYTCH